MHSTTRVLSDNGPIANWEGMNSVYQMKGTKVAGNFLGIFRKCIPTKFLITCMHATDILVAVMIAKLCKPPNMYMIMTYGLEVHD